MFSLVTASIIFGNFPVLSSTPKTNAQESNPSTKNRAPLSHISDRSNVGAGGVTSTIAGPYKIMLSVRDVLVEAFVRKT